MSNDGFDLRRARINDGKTGRALAAELGISRETLRRLESHEVVSVAAAKKVADYFTERLGTVVQVTDLMPIETIR